MNRNIPAVNMPAGIYLSNLFFKVYNEKKYGDGCNLIIKYSPP